MLRPRVLTIAGSDPSGGAGIQADLKTFAAWRTYGQAVVTVLTAQDTTGVRGVHAAPPEFVGQCIDLVLSDCPPAAIKTGMLYDAELIEVVALRLARLRGIPLVVDPVMVATSGDPLLRQDAIDALISRMLPLATLVTPNLHEAEILGGRSIDGIDDAWDAAARIVSRGARAVLVKGGHFASPLASDLLMLADGVRVRFDRPRLAIGRPHGTGCTLSAAVAAALAHGLELEESVRRAGDWVHLALAGAEAVGRGGVPLDHCVAVEGFAT